MYSVVSCAIVHGIDSLLVRAETDLSSGLPVFEMVGFLSSEVKEARERVRTAMNNCGYALPIKRITVNLSPAHIRKSGSGFDLPVAVSILAAMGVIAKRDLSDIVMVGELGLNGQIYPVSGVLPMILAAADCKKRVCLVPVDNYAEAALVPQMTVVAVRDLAEAVAYLNDGRVPDAPQTICEDTSEEEADFRWLQAHCPDLVLNATVHPKMRVLHARENEGTMLAIGPKAAWFGGTSHFVNIVETAGLWGFEGIARLAVLIEDAFLNEKDTRSIVPRKGFGCTCIL